MIFRPIGTCYENSAVKIDKLGKFIRLVRMNCRALCKSLSLHIILYGKIECLLHSIIISQV